VEAVDCFCTEARMKLYPHHQRAVDRLIDRFKDDPNYLALIIAGSLVKGFGNESSDVDFVLIATDEEYTRRQPERAFTYYTTELCDYPGGYVDGKIVNVAFLEEVADLAGQRVDRNQDGQHHDQEVGRVQRKRRQETIARFQIKAITR
jgi:hypothetical protein